MLKASSFGMEIFMGVPSLSSLISKDCMNGISSHLSDHSYPDVFHADNNGRSLGGRIAQRARGSLGDLDHQEELWGLKPPCEGDSSFLPRGVSLILIFGAGFSASISQASAESLRGESCLFQTKQLPRISLSALSKMAAPHGNHAKRCSI